MGSQSFKSLGWGQHEDILEVRLMDASFNVFYKRRVRVKDKGQMDGLINDLRAKGVAFSVGWFD